MLAQSSGDGYNPGNPSDPGNPSNLMKYNVQVLTDTPGAGTVSGAGKYKYGTNATIKATTNTGYKFLYWTKDESSSSYKTATSFTHTVDADVTFTAVYEALKRISAVSSFSGIISTPTITGGTSTTAVVTGGRTYFFTKGATAKLTAASKADYVFRGWKKNNETELCSTANPYSYTVGDEDAVFTAVYDYVPGCPADPTDPAMNLLYNVKVSASIPEAANVTGTGKYKFGTQVTISTSPKAGYAFQSWTKKVGDVETKNFSTSSSFKYTMDCEDVEFTAEYYNIAENLEANGYVLNIVGEPEGLCTFSRTSGLKVLPDDTYSVTVTLGNDVVFDGWYIDGALQSTNKTFKTYMPANDVTLVAKCRYVPFNPDDPGNDLGYVENIRKKGDVNGDGDIDTADAVLVINKYLGKTTTIDESKADMNSDNEIDTADAVLIINKYLNK